MKHPVERRRLRRKFDDNRTATTRGRVPVSSTFIAFLISLLFISVEAFTRSPRATSALLRTTNPHTLPWEGIFTGDGKQFDPSASSKSALSATRKSEKSDVNEWKAVLAALTLYKAAYGDVKVPQRFVVPSAAPWPKLAWGLKLGKVVGNIRSTGKFVQSKPRRRQVLDDLGFVWQARARAQENKEKVTFSQLVEAIVAYRENVGDDSIPPHFVVPDVDPWPSMVRGLPLGAQLAKLPTKMPESARRRLEDLGVVEPRETKPKEKPKPSANDIRFQRVYTALQTYKKIYGDLLVPQPFTVPEEEPWTEDIWGLRLGARVNAIRSQGTFVNSNPDRLQLLDDLGFSWSPPKERLGRRSQESSDIGPYSDDAPATSMESLLGAFDFGQDFIGKGQSGTKAEPTPTWGLEAGRDLPVDDLPGGRANVPAEDEYEPPRTLAESLEEATTRALDCGVIEGMTENKRVIKGKREQDVAWFNDDFGGEFVFEDVVEALTVYKSLYGEFDNLTASEEFVVPTPEIESGYVDDDSYDPLNTDAASRAAAAVAQYEDATELEDQPLASTATSGRSSTNAWPEHLAGMALGNIVARIRDGSLEVKHIEERKVKLDALDFDWGDPEKFLDVPFEKAMCAMYAYYLVRGDMFVREDFVMPDEDPWPRALSGYELGKTVHRVRELQNFFEAYHPEKVSLLRMIDFVWFPTMALPLDPNEPELTNETLLLGGLGHPDYAKMVDVPMGLPDKILAEGPYFESDDPKHWWRRWHNWENVKDYWYQLGRRDNAYVLRKMGYVQMAEEHEAKYGPGLFTRMNATMEEVEQGLEQRSKEEKQEVLRNLNFYRQELLGCTDLPTPERYEWLERLDKEMLKIMEEGDIQLEEEEEEEEYEAEYEYEDEMEEEVAEEDDFVYEEEEFDVEDELGLRDKQ